LPLLLLTLYHGSHGFDVVIILIAIEMIGARATRE
jgi:hypothetical protein